MEKSSVTRLNIETSAKETSLEEEESCGKAGDASDDPFGLAAQFLKKSDDDDEANRVARIIGGQEININAACWQALVVANGASGQHICGGVIVGKATILTAAHCLLATDTRRPLAARDVEVVIGATDSDSSSGGCTETFQVSSTLSHPQYNDHINDNDIALVILSSPIDLAKKPCACTLCLSPREPAVGELCAVSGFGVEMSDFSMPRNPVPLKWVSQTVVSQTNQRVCPVFSDPKTGKTTGKDGFICVTGPAKQDSCLGDDGGPLTCFDPVSHTHYLAGIVSFGSETCGIGLGSQNTKVSSYIDWILENAPVGDVKVRQQNPDQTTCSPIPTTTLVPGAGLPCINPIITGIPTVIPPVSITTTTTSTTTASTTSTTRTTPATTTRPPVKKPCGMPASGGTDPFGIVRQFSSAATNSSHPAGFLHRFVRQRKNIMRSGSRLIEGRILGGLQTTANEICWQALVLADFGTSIMTCGGVIVGSRTILTSTACLLDQTGKPLPTSVLSVTVGAVDSFAPSSNTQDPSGCAQTYTVQSALINPAFLNTTNDNDLGILTLTSVIDIDNKTCACTLCLTTRTPATGEKCIISGYGQTSPALNNTSPIPLKWTLQTVEAQFSQDANSNCSLVGQGSVVTNSSNFICTFGGVGQGACLGDNGGPLACYNPTENNYYLAGIVSFTEEICGSGMGGQNLMISKYLQWIADNSLAGDVIFDTTAVVTQPPGSLSTVAPSGNCGHPGTGVVDPFGLASQFASGTTLRKTSVFPTIVGGQLTANKEICWQAILTAIDGTESFTCGGTIIGSLTILTAAHCTVSETTGQTLSPSMITIAIGSNNLPASLDSSGCAKSFSVAEVHTHPNYDPQNTDNDIGIIVLSTAIDLTKNGGCYCRACVTDRTPVTGEICATSGYGLQIANATVESNPSPLSWVTLPVIAEVYNQNVCSLNVDNTNGMVTDLNGFICAGGVVGEDSCRGDSGGPFTCYNPTTTSYYVAGIVSFGRFPCAVNVGSQYTKVAHYLDFISAFSPAGDVAISVTNTATTTALPIVTIFTVTTIPTATTTAGSGGNQTTTAYYDFYPGYSSALRRNLPN